MNVYASTPAFAQRRPQPQTLLFIIAGHVAVIAAVMAAKMDLPQKILNSPTVVTLIPVDEPPPPEPQAQQDPAVQPIPSRPQAEVPVPLPPQPSIDTMPSVTPTPLPTLPSLPAIEPQPPAQTVPEPVRTGPRFATPPSEVRPPYPESKRRSAEEAVLKLRLSIDGRGRVIAVEPVGRADRAFLEAARKHILGHWRYKPATEDGRAVASSTVITLRFELDD